MSIEEKKEEPIEEKPREGEEREGPTEEVSIVEELPSEEKEPIEEPVEEPVEERPATKKPWWKFW